MKRLLLLAMIVAGIAACDTPKPTTTNPDSDTVTNTSSQTDTTMRRDSLPKQ